MGSTKAKNLRPCNRDIFGDLCSQSRALCKVEGMLGNGLYVLQLAQWLEFYNDTNMMVIKSEDFYNNTAVVMNSVSEFLGLMPLDWSETVQNVFNIISPNSASADKHTILPTAASMLKVGKTDPNNVADYPQMNSQTRRRLEQFYAPFNAKLASLYPQ